MKRGTFLIIMAIVIIGIFLVLIIYPYGERRSEEKEMLKEDCDYFVVIETGWGLSLDCYSGIFYNRMKEFQNNGTYCFLNVLDDVRLKCNWNGGLSSYLKGEANEK